MLWWNIFLGFSVIILGTVSLHCRILFANHRINDLVLLRLFFLWFFLIKFVVSFPFGAWNGSLSHLIHFKISLIFPFFGGRGKLILLIYSNTVIPYWIKSRPHIMGKTFVVPYWMKFKLGHFLISFFFLIVLLITKSG